MAYTADGREQARHKLTSATGKITIAAKPEVTEAKAGEVVYVPVELIGKNGVVESNTDRKLRVTVTGGELLGFGSANSCHEEQYHTGSFTTYYGRALAIVRVTDNTTINITDGKCSASVQIPVRNSLFTN